MENKNIKQNHTKHGYDYNIYKLNMMSNEIIFYKEYVIDMCNNLINLHKCKLYEGINNGYSTIFNEISILKNKLDKIPDNININYLKKTNIETLSNNISDIRLDIIKYSNHIVPIDIRMILHILIGYNWMTFFNIDDLNKINLMGRLFNSISVWDSLFHTDIIKYEENTIVKRKANNRDTINNLTDDNTKTSSIIIGDINAFPMFIKSLSDMVILKDKKKIKNERKNNYNYIDLINYFKENNNVVFIKNENVTSLIEEKNGFNVLIKINERIIVIQGFAKDDMLELYKTNNLIKNYYDKIKNHVLYNIITVPKFFRNNFIDIINIRDILINTLEEIDIIIKKKYNDYKSFKLKTIGNIINDFLLASKYRKIDIITILLCGDQNDCKLGYLLYDIIRIKDKKELMSEIYNSLPTKFKIRLDEAENIIIDEEENLIKNHMGDLSYERRINMIKVENSIKDKAIEKLKSLKNNFQGDSKAQSWLDGFLKIPFGTYCENKLMNFKKNFTNKIDLQEGASSEQIKNHISQKIELKDEWNKYAIEKSNYLKLVHKNLDNTVYGHKDAKLQLERLFAQWINGETKGAVIGLCGPPGTGKTSLAKNGLSKCLIDDDGKSRPFAFLPIGGSTNGSTLVGHNYTYVGATWGRIADILMTSNCMNPIIFIDEVDKISNTEYGKEITSILTHLTDATQNDSFEDKYFSGIPLDLSKALIVFSFNDISLLDPILRDRITIIETKPYTLLEKIHIIQEYMLPEVLKDVGFHKDEIIFNPEIITYLIETYTNEAGVRKIKEKIVDIVRDINLNIIHEIDNDKWKLPFIVTIEYINLIFKNKPKVRINMIHKTPEIGLVNGLYATTTGIGGLTAIQVIKYPSEKMLDLTLTGQQGEVMKESMQYALRIAYNMLNDEEKNKILEDSKNKNNFGLLIHTPEAATKKDGPSAGAAISLAIYSVLTGKKIKNDIAMTGEIDLCKNVRAIGGVNAKLAGAKAAGVKLALIPKENLDDLNILRNDNISPEDNNFKVEIIDTFEDVIKFALL
jgi:ATP-dependent Lon protease